MYSDAYRNVSVLAVSVSVLTVTTTYRYDHVRRIAISSREAECTDTHE